MRHAISWTALDRGVEDANRRLREMCGGEQLVEILGGWSWAFDPAHSELTYTVKDGAPEEAVERARRICRRASFATSFNVVEPDYRDGYTYDLWFVGA